MSALQTQLTTSITRYVRFRDLVTAGIVGNWPTLLRLIECEGFPVGIMIGRNTRAWALDDVESWLAARLGARKFVKPARKPRNRRAATEADFNDLFHDGTGCDVIAMERAMNWFNPN
jgi:predicted DNA-binding transcriptional regulator AlpA